ncbi:hypothetical protein KDW_56010 [Dictyobacter vulcani]|uniref:Uncharacterized protein n=1 Tax=Dictyobacter vulcani TaxID=2607529 RepID=A0A5J4KZ97_9CHLR|nr:hypothetical protein KDW_56010 [Dictyobacter vulcani]
MLAWCCSQFDRECLSTVSSHSTELKVTTSPMAQHLLSAPQKTRQQQYQELQNLAQQGLSAERIARW